MIFWEEEINEETCKLNADETKVETYNSKSGREISLDQKKRGC